MFCWCSRLIRSYRISLNLIYYNVLSFFFCFASELPVTSASVRYVNRTKRPPIAFKAEQSSSAHPHRPTSILVSMFMLLTTMGLNQDSLNDCFRWFSMSQACHRNPTTTTTIHTNQPDLAVEIHCKTVNVIIGGVVPTFPAWIIRPLVMSSFVWPLFQVSIGYIIIHVYIIIIVEYIYLNDREEILPDVYSWTHFSQTGKTETKNKINKYSPWFRIINVKSTYMSQSCLYKIRRLATQYRFGNDNTKK